MLVNREVWDQLDQVEDQGRLELVVNGENQEKPATKADKGRLDPLDPLAQRVSGVRPET